MNTLSRGMRNAFRNSIRTFSIVIILGLSIGLALAMLVARASVENKIQSIKTSVGNTISISPAGLRGFQGGGEPLTMEQMDKVASLPNVTKVTRTLNDRLTSETSNLQSAIEPGSLGNRGAGNSGIVFRGPSANIGGNTESGEQPTIRTFTPPVTITGTDSPETASVYGGDTVQFTSGNAFSANSEELVAVVGTGLASKNSLSVGSTFTAYGKQIKVVGIFDAGSMFANSNVVMPLKTLQTLSDQANSITNATVTVDSIDNMDNALKSVQSTLGSSADITSSQETAKEVLGPLENVKTISTFSLLGAIGAGAIIILLTMVMIVRERRKEIGVFKAIGASNLKVMLQFMSEACTLTVLGLVAGLIIGSAAASPLTNVLVNNSKSTPSATQSTNVPPLVRGNGNTLRIDGPISSFRNIGDNTLANARTVQASVGWEIIGYGIITAFVIAIIGSAIPALLISKIRPAEVMRAE